MQLEPPWLCCDCSNTTQNRHDTGSDSAISLSVLERGFNNPRLWVVTALFAQVLFAPLRRSE